LVLPLDLANLLSFMFEFR